MARIIIVVVILKLIFWIFYFYARNRRRLIAQALRQHSQQQIPQGRQYEEEPAVPQPAYVFTEYPFGVNGVPANLQNPPVYSVEDPVKLDEPPPPYINDDDTGGLIENQEN